MKISIALSVPKSLEKKLENLSKPIDLATAKAIGKSTVTLMKAAIASGSSPIEGRGSFPAYKDPKRYPGKRKRATPVNLTLSGKFLKSLTSRVEASEGQYSVVVGYPAAESPKEHGHRDGAKGQPKRPTIPRGGELFIKKIRDAYMAILRKRIESLVK